MQPTEVARPRTQREIIDSFKAGEIDEIECVWGLFQLEGRGGKISRVTQAVVRIDTTLPKEKRGILNRAGSAIDAYMDTEPYLKEWRVYEAIKMLGEMTQTEILRFYARIDQEGIKEKIREKTERKLRLSTVMYMLIVGRKVQVKGNTQDVVGKGTAYERSKAKILREVYGQLQEDDNKRAHTAAHFARVVRYNWDVIRRNETVRDTYRDGDKIPKKPWVDSYCRLIHAAIKAGSDYTKKLEGTL